MSVTRNIEVPVLLNNIWQNCRKRKHKICAWVSFISASGLQISVWQVTKEFT